MINDASAHAELPLNIYCNSVRLFGMFFFFLAFSLF